MLNRQMNRPHPRRRPSSPQARRPLTRLAVAALSAGLSFAGLGLAGCQEHHDRDWLQVGTLALRRDISVGEPIRNRDEANLLFVAVPVHNLTDKQLYVQGVMTFYDHYGNELSRVSRTITIPADQSERFQGNSTSPQAESFHLALNYPRVE